MNETLVTAVNLCIQIIRHLESLYRDVYGDPYIYIYIYIFIYLYLYIYIYTIVHIYKHTD